MQKTFFLKWLKFLPKIILSIKQLLRFFYRYKIKFDDYGWSTETFVQTSSLTIWAKNLVYSLLQISSFPK